MRYTSLRPIASIALLALAVAACSDSTSAGGDPSITLSFVSADAPAPTAAPQIAASPMRAVDAPGSNGTLTIDEIQIVVDEFKLEAGADACEEESEQDDCARFEALPYFLDLPLDAVPVDVATSTVPEGTYVALKLETKDLESSSGPSDPEIESLADEVRAAFPDWPADASLRVAGSFDPEDGSDIRPFVVYFHAEVKVELSFDPSLTVSSDDESTFVVVEVDPVAWFTLPDGAVSDLSELDFATTEEVVDFEAKMADGFTKIEIDG